ncbi:hypothetical protein MAR_023657 [Mya arenaria]|uniref:Uncharacterized protein n=1 Tax=Mya arenaria TaxID=6604 RepID=A0ABY7DNK6_MYAAR|nr:hypothetical protein MAR_023657 [Mya arenaria]
MLLLWTLTKRSRLHELIITIQNCKVHDANFLEQKPTRDCDNLILRSACTAPDIISQMGKVKIEDSSNFCLHEKTP